VPAAAQRHGEVWHIIVITSSSSSYELAEISLRFHAVVVMSASPFHQHRLSTRAAGRPGKDGGLDDMVGYRSALIIDAAFYAAHRQWVDPKLQALGVSVLTVRTAIFRPYSDGLAHRYFTHTPSALPSSVRCVIAAGPVLLIAWCRVQSGSGTAGASEGGAAPAAAVTTEDSVGACLAEHELEGGAVLVRPDRYILGGATTQEGLAALLGAAAYGCEWR
jgi:hypothetical protein